MTSHLEIELRKRPPILIIYLCLALIKETKLIRISHILSSCVVARVNI